MWKCKKWWNNQLACGIWCGSLSQHPLLPARHKPHWNFGTENFTWRLDIVQNAPQDFRFKKWGDLGRHFMVFVEKIGKIWGGF